MAARFTRPILISAWVRTNFNTSLLTLQASWRQEPLASLWATYKEATGALSLTDRVTLAIIREHWRTSAFCQHGVFLTAIQPPWGSMK